MTRNNEYKTFRSTKYKFAKILCPKCIWESPTKITPKKETKLNLPESKTIIDRIYSSFNRRQLSQNTNEELLWEIKSRLSKPLPEIPIAEAKSQTNRRVTKKTPLFPDLLNIFNLPYYWGEMDRYEAEAELKGCEDGTYLLRDSAQEEFLFSVSFNRFGRTIHARVEFVNGHYTFDSHYGTAPSIGMLLSLYKNTNETMFYHPLCRTPRNRRDTFSLQNLCRSVICSSLRYYEDIYELNISNNLLRKMHFSHFKIPLLYCNYNNESLQTTTSSS